MKNLFGVTKDEKNNLSEFIIREIEEDKSEELDELSDEGAKLKKEKLAPTWMLYVMYIAGGLGFLGVVIPFANDNGGIAASMKNAPYVLYVGIGLVVLAVALYLYIRIKNKKANEDLEVNDYLKRVDDTVSKCLQELGVPEDFKKADLLFSMEKEKNGETVNTKIGGMFNYVNQELNVFAENNNLCFADNTSVIAIPFDSITNIEKIKKNTLLPEWNKSEPIKKYKEYKVVQNSYGINIKYLYKFYLNVDGKKLYFIVPNYDYETIINIIGKDNLLFNVEFPEDSEQE